VGESAVAISSPGAVGLERFHPGKKEIRMNLMAPAPVSAIVYPDDDGLPMADNTKQLRWIVVLYDNLCALFHAVVDVFVAGNHLWYPMAPKFGWA
jgi:hypothetical protein